LPLLFEVLRSLQWEGCTKSCRENIQWLQNFVGSDVGDGFNFGAGRQQYGEVGQPEFGGDLPQLAFGF
jgi:hypothetical protein